jgi:hypothetical protein
MYYIQSYKVLFGCKCCLNDIIVSFFRISCPYPRKNGWTVLSQSKIFWINLKWENIDLWNQTCVGDTWGNSMVEFICLTWLIWKRETIHLYHLPCMLRSIARHYRRDYLVQNRHSRASCMFSVRGLWHAVVKLASGKLLLLVWKKDTVRSSLKSRVQSDLHSKVPTISHRPLFFMPENCSKTHWNNRLSSEFFGDARRVWKQLE